jgi:hypothetical protein
MEDRTVCMDRLVRIGGVSAILAGVLRAASSFASGPGEIERQTLYFIVDLLLLIGVLAVYAQNHESLGRWGGGGFLATVTGILLVRSSRAVPGFDLYPAGALTVAGGWLLLSVMWWKAAKGSGLVPLLFLLSVVIGAVGQLVPRAATLVVASGVVFGAAMVGVGAQVLAAARRARRATSNDYRD